MFQKVRLFCLLVILVFGLGAVDSIKPISATEILALVNQDRAKEGLSSLNIDPTLSTAASLKAVDMIRKNYFAHVSPEGVKPWHWFKVSGYQYTYAGENLAIGFTDAQELQATWMNSPDHRANILSPFYSEMGLSVVEEAGKTLVVEFFGSKDNKLTLRQ